MKRRWLFCIVIAIALAAAFGAWLGARRDAQAQAAVMQARLNLERNAALARKLDRVDAESRKYLEWRTRTAKAKAAQVVGGKHSAAESRKLAVIVTAYDLSYESCGKSPSHPQYGVTASGRDLRGHTLESARAIAVDPEVIPLGARVRLSFDESAMKGYDGVYIACDTGGAIVGNRIDLFVGEDNRDEAMRIGRRTATATVEG